MAVKKTPRAIIEVLDAEGKVTGHEIESHYIYEAESDDDPMVRVARPSVQRDPATEEEVALLRGSSAEGLTADNQALREANAELQKAMELVSQQAAEQVAAANQERDLAIAAETRMRGVLDTFFTRAKEVLGR